jgi:predicted HTH domain antitoxin
MPWPPESISKFLRVILPDNTISARQEAGRERIRRCSDIGESIGHLNAIVERGSAKTAGSTCPAEYSRHRRPWAAMRGGGRMAGSTPACVDRYNRGRRESMRTITIELPDTLPPALGASDEEVAREARLALAILWYDRGLISQGKGAEIAGLTRAEFIDELGRANVSAIQTSVEELREEMEQVRNAGR